jgi:membrane protein implicated in regulation of membrane protease activity
MEIVFNIISFIFVGLIIAAALTIGFSLLLWLMAISVVATLVFILRQYYFRWRFLRENKQTTDIIEGVYTEVIDKKP